MSNHREQNEQISKNRRAVAPYNFVALPEQVIAAEEAGAAQVQMPKQGGQDETYPHLVRHDSYHAGRHTGQITAELVTASPLYTRTGLSLEEFAAIAGKSFHELSDDNKQRYAQFFELRGKPAIPGSSLRGMLRSMVEIVAQGKLTRVMQDKPFFRTLTEPATKGTYYQFFLEEVGRLAHRPNPPAPCYKAKVQAGFFRRQRTGYTIEACPWGRIDRIDIPGNPPQRDLYDGRGPNMTPSWNYQHRKIYVQLDAEADHFFREQRNQNGQMRHPNMYLRFRKVSFASFEKQNGLQEGQLVLTGNMQHKHLEFVFLSDTTQTYRISDDMVRRFHDNDQITQWQQNAFPKERPRVNSRSHKEDGLLQDGDPVFFLLDDEGHVKFFGRAQNFRLLYPYAPYDFVPSELRNPEITDMAEAIFGYVPMDDGKTKDNRQAYAGRVFVADAPLKEGQDAAQIWLTGDQGSYIVPRILGGPKPTTFQHYLVQEQEERRELKHYASTPGEDTVIRGHKLYWHQGHTQDWKSHLRHPDTQPGSEGSQHTGICPVQPGVYFELNIRFENLSDVELGALLWVLRLATNENHALKLGMGKPLGMGSVRVNTLIVKESDRERRYTSLFDEHGNWETGDTTWDAQAQQARIEAFQAYVYENSGETVGSFDELPRVRTLLHLLNWPGPEASATRYMELGEFRNRPVLPTPADVMDDTKNGGEPPKGRQRQQPPPPKEPELNTEQRIKGKVEAVKSNYYTVALPDNVWGRLGVPRSDVEQVRLERTDDVPRLGKGASTPNCVAVKVEDGTLYIRVAPKKKE